ncbi:hypothetical protein E8E13_011480 [Curvularia kusanoi]|uniref:Major facilitator superfamily (MFS) profile domain-containing protein n=1 Tax=Curvularia kusanoi TaxID=90978 RepID=A0A9P4WEZ6_CURKU|nr:hypothetical protein E8E13_011480 [Curvularia kusanoi]
MTSHADNYGLPASFTTIALFGANGQIGEHILHALVTSKRKDFKVIAFIPPGADLQTSQSVTIKSFDVEKATRAQLAEDLEGVDAVVSAVNGPAALEAQATIQDAAADAGVQRFYPSEYGMHHIYRKPGDPMGYIHPAWNVKALANERVIRHLAVRERKMSFTVIGCGDFYNQARERVWCPWTQDPSSVDQYTLHAIGNPHAEADYTHLDDLGSFVVATLLEPAKSHNAFLNVVSDTISTTHIARLLCRYSGKKVEVNVLPKEKMHEIWEDPAKAPAEHSDSAFPVDFWYLVKGTQGKGDDESSDEKLEDGKRIVEVTGADDPIDPHNWPLHKRARTVLILSLLIFTQAWAGACDSIANTKASKQYHVSPVAQNLSTAVYLFGIGCGCLFVGPLSQTFGRNPAYLGFTLVYLPFILGTALSRNYGTQIVCRFFAGLASSAALGINGGSIGDMFRPVERALWFPVIAWVNVVPPVIAPIAGGWVVSRDYLDWRWVNWITFIISGFALLIALFFLPETYLPMLLDYKASHLRRLSGSPDYVTKHASFSFPQQLKHVIHTSVRMTTVEPPVISLGCFLVLLYVILFTFLSGFDYVFKRQYDLSDLEEGACFASIALGATSVSLCAPALHAWTWRQADYDARASVRPEFRLWPAIITAPLLPISLFWLGWTNYARISIYSGLAACFCFGIVLNAIRGIGAGAICVVSIREETEGEE